ncbi:MAG: SufD family Fe-S cluster assembly protein, partial [Gammaproteobacteria bacterium]|nr:SufD family Fe-S cluster assembly protein [Gammaproteobacteria bacterium]
ALDGLTLIGGRQLADTHTTIDHAQAHGSSRQINKAIVDGGAHAVFNGKIMVRKDAQQTDSAQSSRNLLLSDKARVDTKPQFEIFADDVKCAHGATVGQLDVDELFYLKSRGLSEATARSLLIYAFAAEIIEKIPVVSVKNRLQRLVMEQMHLESIGGVT